MMKNPSQNTEVTGGDICVCGLLCKKTPKQFNKNDAANLQVLQVVLLDVLGEIVHLTAKHKKQQNCEIPQMLCGIEHFKTNTLPQRPRLPTCTELVMVLRANTVAQSLMVDWLSKAP